MTQASRTLTAATLVRLGACPEQVALFRATFGDSVEVTPALTAEHVDAYKWSWAADHLLSHAARDAYRAAMLSASDAYYAAVASASDAFDAAVACASAARRMCGIMRRPPAGHSRGRGCRPAGARTGRAPR